MSQHFPEQHQPSVKYVKVELDLFNYATKVDLKGDTGFDTSTLESEIVVNEERTLELREPNITVKVRINLKRLLKIFFNIIHIYIYIYIYIYICIYMCDHENNVFSWFSPQWLCSNSYT